MIPEHTKASTWARMRGLWIAHLKRQYFYSRQRLPPPNRLISQDFHRYRPLLHFARLRSGSRDISGLYPSCHFRDTLFLLLNFLWIPRSSGVNFGTLWMMSSHSLGAWKEEDIPLAFLFTRALDWIGLDTVTRARQIAERRRFGWQFCCFIFHLFLLPSRVYDYSCIERDRGKGERDN